MKFNLKIIVPIFTNIVHDLIFIPQVQEKLTNNPPCCHVTFATRNYPARLNYPDT